MNDTNMRRYWRELHPADFRQAEPLPGAYPVYRIGRCGLCGLMIEEGASCARCLAEREELRRHQRQQSRDRWTTGLLLAALVAGMFAVGCAMRANNDRIELQYAQSLKEQSR